MDFIPYPGYPWPTLWPRYLKYYVTKHGPYGDPQWRRKVFSSGEGANQFARVLESPGTPWEPRGPYIIDELKLQKGP